MSNSAAPCSRDEDLRAKRPLIAKWRTRQRITTWRIRGLTVRGYRSTQMRTLGATRFLRIRNPRSQLSPFCSRLIARRAWPAHMEVKRWEALSVRESSMRRTVSGMVRSSGSTRKMSQHCAHICLTLCRVAPSWTRSTSHQLEVALGRDRLAAATSGSGLA